MVNCNGCSASYLNRGLHRQRETLPKLGADFIIPGPSFQQVFSLHSPLKSRRLGLSRIKQTGPDLFPGDDSGGVLLTPSYAIIKLRPLRVRQRYRISSRLSQTVSSSSAFSAGEM